MKYEIRYNSYGVVLLNVFIVSYRIANNRNSKYQRGSVMCRYIMTNELI